MAGELWKKSLLKCINNSDDPDGADLSTNTAIIERHLRKLALPSDAGIKIKPEEMHLELIEALLECENNRTKNVRPVQNTHDPVLDVKDVGQLRGYQYLTNYLLLSINERMVKYLNILSSKIDKLEKAAGVSWGDINVETYWWYDQISNLEKLMKSEQEKLSSLETEHSRNCKDIADIFDIISRHNRYDKDIEVLVKEAVEVLTQKANMNKIDIDAIESRYFDHQISIDSCKLSLANVNERLDNMKNNTEENKSDVEPCNNNSEAIRSDIEGICQFNIEMNDKLAFASNGLLKNEYKTLELNSEMDKLKKQHKETNKINANNFKAVCEKIEVLEHLCVELKKDIDGYDVKNVCEFSVLYTKDLEQTSKMDINPIQMENPYPSLDINTCNKQKCKDTCLDEATLLQHKCDSCKTKGKKVELLGTDIPAHRYHSDVGDLNELCSKKLASITDLCQITKQHASEIETENLNVNTLNGNDVSSEITKLHAGNDSILHKLEHIREAHITKLGKLDDKIGENKNQLTIIEPLKHHLANVSNDIKCMKQQYKAQDVTLNDIAKIEGEICTQISLETAYFNGRVSTLEDKMNACNGMVINDTCVIKNLSDQLHQIKDNVDVNSKKLQTLCKIKDDMSQSYQDNFKKLEKRETICLKSQNEIGHVSEMESLLEAKLKYYDKVIPPTLLLSEIPEEKKPGQENEIEIYKQDFENRFSTLEGRCNETETVFINKFKTHYRRLDESCNENRRFRELLNENQLRMEEYKGNVNSDLKQLCDGLEMSRKTTSALTDDLFKKVNIIERKQESLADFLESFSIEDLHQIKQTCKKYASNCREECFEPLRERLDRNVKKTEEISGSLQSMEQRLGLFSEVECDNKQQVCSVQTFQNDLAKKMDGFITNQLPEIIANCENTSKKVFELKILPIQTELNAHYNNIEKVMVDYKKIIKTIEQLSKRDINLSKNFIEIKTLMNILTKNLEDVVASDIPNMNRELTRNEEDLVTNLIEPLKQKLNAYGHKINNLNSNFNAVENKLNTLGRNEIHLKEKMGAIEEQHNRRFCDWEKIEVEKLMRNADKYTLSKDENVLQLQPLKDDILLLTNTFRTLKNLLYEVEFSIERLGYNNEKLEEKVVFLGNERNYIQKSIKVFVDENLERAMIKMQEATDQKTEYFVKSLKKDLSEGFEKVNNTQLIFRSAENEMESLVRRSDRELQEKKFSLEHNRNNLSKEHEDVKDENEIAMDNIKTISQHVKEDTRRPLNKKQQQILCCLEEDDKFSSKSSSSPCLGGFIRDKFGSCIRIDTNT